MTRSDYELARLHLNKFNETAENADMCLTADNTYSFDFYFAHYFDSHYRSTHIMQAFVEDEKDYFVFSFGQFMKEENVYHLYLVWQRTNPRRTLYNSMSFSDFKNFLSKNQAYIERSGSGQFHTYLPRSLHPLMQIIYNTLPNPLVPGLFTAKQPMYLRAQLPSDRRTQCTPYGIFGHQYGECSVAFSLAGILLR